MQEDSTPIALRRITLTRTFAEMSAANLIKSTAIWVLGEQGALEDKYLGLLEAEQTRRSLSVDEALELIEVETAIDATPNIGATRTALVKRSGELNR